MSPIDANQQGNKTPGTNGTAPTTSDSQLLSTLMAQANGETAPGGPPGLSSSPTVGGLLQALRRRWLLAFGLATLAAAATVFAVFQIFPPKYMANIRLRVAAKQMGPDDVEFPIFKANMEWLVKSPFVINAALNEKLPDGREIKDLSLVREKGLTAASWLETTLKTDYLLGPEILRVTLPADNPDDAAELLNAIAKSFLSEYETAELNRMRKQQRIADLRRIKEHDEENVRSLQQLLKNQMESLKIRDADSIKMEIERLAQEKSLIRSSLRLNDDELAKWESETNTLKARLKNLTDFPVPVEYREEYLHKDDVLKLVKKDLIVIDLEIDGYYEKWQKSIADRYARDKLREKATLLQLKKKREAEVVLEITPQYRNKKRTEMEEQLEKSRGMLENYARRRESIMTELKSLDGKLAGLTTGRPAALQATESKLKMAHDDVEEAARKIREVQLEAVNSRVSPLDRAGVPSSRDISRQTKIAGAGGAGMFGLVLFGIAFLEFRSRKICMTEEVTRGLGLNVIGTVPAIPRRSKKSSNGNDIQEHIWQTRLNESLDAIRTVLLHNARKDALKVVMVSSANSGEGKTTLATQLAASLARAWKRTLLIDGDMRNPHAHELFDVPLEPGLAEVLRGEIEVNDAIQATSFSRLWILSAGNGDTHAIQALAQDNVTAILTALKQQYDFIVVDSPPILPVTDSLLLGQHVDGVLFTILSDVSRAPAVYAAQQKLAPLGVHMLGAVVLGTHPEYSDKNYRYLMGTK